MRLQLTTINYSQNYASISDLCLFAGPENRRPGQNDNYEENRHPRQNDDYEENRRPSRNDDYASTLAAVSRPSNSCSPANSAIVAEDILYAAQSCKT